MCKRPRLALAALSLFLCLHLWGTPSEAVPTGGVLAISEDPRAASVSFDTDESRKVLKSFNESVYAEPGRKTLHSVPSERRDVAQPTSLQFSDAPPRRVRKDKSTRAWWRKKLTRKLRKLRKTKGRKPGESGKDGESRKNGKANKVKKGRKSRELLRSNTTSGNSLPGLRGTWVKTGKNSLESTVMEKGSRHRNMKLRHSKKKGVGSSSRSKKPQATTKMHSNQTQVVENVSQPKDQDKDALEAEAPDSASVIASSSSHALVSDIPTPKPTATSKEPAMAQSVEPVANQTSEPAMRQPGEPVVMQSGEPVAIQPSTLAVETPGELRAAKDFSEPMITQLGEPVTTQLIETVATQPSELAAAKNSSEPVTKQTSEPAAMKPIELAAKNSSEPVTTQSSEPAAAKPSGTAMAHSNEPTGVSLNNTVNAADSGDGGKQRKSNPNILVPVFE